MDYAITSLDWSLVQAFLAVAETGSLSAAARQMRVSQPTLGRQIKAMEAQLQADLFHRQPRGLTLTDTGAAILSPAQDMRRAMRDIALTAAGRQVTLTGTVRITASVVASFFHMPAIIAAIRVAEPDIAIDLVPADESRNLLFREADIAVRMYRPTQNDLIAQQLGTLSIGTYAAHSYLARRGRPTIATLLDHDIIGFDASPLIIDGMAQGGLQVTRDFFKVRCDDQLTYWALVRAGAGIGFAQDSIAANDPLVKKLDIGLQISPLPVWLTAHAAMRQTPRIRRVWDLLAAGLKPLLT